MQVSLPDGTQLTLDDGATGADAAAAIGAGLARAALAVKVDGTVRDLSAALPDGAQLEIVTSRSPEALALIRHDAAHVLAEAMLELYPGVKISIGPAIEDGFYYDFDFPEGTHFSEADFPRVEAKMAEHIKAAEPFTCQQVPVAEALERFRAQDQPYKVELIEDLVRDEGVQTVGLYTNGAFVDLCRGPHAPTTKSVKAVKLQSVAGAYWRGDANRQMLTRVYGTAFLSKEELEAHLQRLEEAKARDHRKLGRELELFQFSEVSPGSAFWLPKGTHLFNELVALSREMGRTRGYTEVKTPQIYDSQLWKTSGHWDKYRENMFVTESGGSRAGAQADELPGPLPAVQAAEVLLPRPARPLQRAGPAAPQRAVGHAARAAAGAPLRAGRRARVLHRGAGPGRGRRDARLRLRHLRDLRLRGRRSSCPRAPRSASAPTRCGTTRRAPCAPRWSHAAWTTRSTRATAPSTGPRSTCT